MSEEVKSWREEHRQRVIASCDKYNEIGPLEDGFQYFFIKDRGALSAFDLRVIADELDARNKASHEHVEQHFRSVEP